ncbi:MAG: hemolysin family protein [Nitrospiraceae bacterium]|nr:hemolysin family protein [Nitrospiraceae bacterium]
MEPPSILNILFIILSILALAALSSVEASFIAANRYRIRSLIEKNDKRAIILKKILDHPDKLFSAVIVSANMLTIFATALGTLVAVKLLGSKGVIISTIVMTFLTVIFGELTPKTFAMAHADEFALSLSKPVQIYMKLIHPLVWFFSHFLSLIGIKQEPLPSYLTVDEIKAAITIGEEAGTLEEEEKELLHRVFEFGDMMVSEVMVPRTEIVSISSMASTQEAMSLVKDEGYSRYPVIGESIDDISGILYIKDILIKMAEGKVKEDTPVTEIMREPYFVPENKMLSELLDEMQKRKFQIAIVIDEYGGTDGLITFEDIMEEIVGGLQDEFEEIEAGREVEIIDERTFIVSGQTGMDEVNELVGADMKTAEFHTIGGFVFGLFGRLPKTGEQIRYQNLRFLILEMEERKISRVKITKL